MPTFGFADKVISYTNSGAGPIDDGPYGGTYGGGADNFPVAVDLDVVLGDDPGATVDFLSLPTGSQVTVAFTDEFIVDGAGDDIFISEVAANDERAEIYVGNGKTFTLIGEAGSGQVARFDLADIDYTGFVTQIRIVGLDSKGGSPGFDVVNVQGLTDAIFSKDDDNDIDGSDGDDTIDLGKGDDSFAGGGGKDVAKGGAGDDALSGGAGKDKLVGGRGRDDLDGDGGRDRIDGGAGKDHVEGGNGNDALKGGRGADVFVFDMNDGKDRVTDFTDGVDLILLHKTLDDVAFSDVEIDAMGGDTLISFGDTEILLRNVDATAISESDFIYAMAIA